MPVRKRGLVMITLVALLSGFTMITSSPAQAETWVGMRNRGSGLCIDNATEDHSKVQSWQCSIKHPAQQWQRLFSTVKLKWMFMNRNTGLCMELAANNIVVMSPCEISFSKPTQTWTVFFAFNENGWYQLWKNDASQACLFGGIGNGSILVTLPCSQPATFERWSFVVP